MDLKQLKYFRQIAESGSISAASQVLGVAQPALSLHVRNMEEHLGTKLLIRQARGVALTEAGSLLLHRAKIVLDEIARIEDDVRNLGASPKGDVRLGLPGTIGDILSVPLVLAVKDRFSDVRLTISDAMSGFVLNWLREGLIDLAVLYMRVEDKTFESELLLSEELVLLAPKNMDVPARIAPARLMDLPLILPSTAHGLRTLLDGWARQYDLTLTTEVEIDSYSNTKTLVERGMGCSILPFHAVNGSAREGMLRLARFEKQDLRRNVYLVQRRNGHSSHASEAVATLAHHIVGDLVTSGIWAGAISGTYGEAGLLWQSDETRAPHLFND
ncbi:HTH-type transcriptional regulator CynR (plasmid) [Antarctobacter heliothermus]|uniref:HTH-type transcriptional regulator CynR n=1 Tax=Antarctobacter heliothermus TaxID=74033 RepID=A0A222EC12_9RHOB|nr:LysR family transcriptional regulator [Antarctobacter heliothermus]ASP23521.1 HTH-type transcriptional regulator CynR [Antarctobacter heliothermus]